MRALKSFLLGALAVGLVAYAAAAAVAVAAQAGEHALTIALGPMQVVSVTVQDAATVTTFGPGLLAVAFAGGVANLLAAWTIQRRAEGRSDRVD